MLRFMTQEHQRMKESVCAHISARLVRVSRYRRSGNALQIIVRRAGDGYRADRTLRDYWRRSHICQSIWACTAPLYPGRQGGRISAARPVMASNVVYHTVGVREPVG